MATDSTSQVMDGNYVAPWPNQAKDFDPANSDDKFHDCAFTSLSSESDNKHCILQRRQSSGFEVG